MKQGLTMAEKIIAGASGRTVVRPGEFVTAKIDILMTHDGSFDNGYALMVQSGHNEVWDPDKIVVGIEHRVPAPTILNADEIRDLRSLAVQGRLDRKKPNSLGKEGEIDPFY